jgi:hypothetical protein
MVDALFIKYHADENKESWVTPLHL